MLSKRLHELASEIGMNPEPDGGHGDALKSEYYKALDEWWEKYERNR